MIRITRLDVDGLGPVTDTIDLSQPLIITGANDAGKTTRLKALQLALLGSIPGENSRPMDILRRSSNGRIRIAAHADVEPEGCVIERFYSRTGSKCTSNTILQHGMESDQGKEAEDMINRIFQPQPYYFDLGEFSSAEQRKRFLTELCDASISRDEALLRFDDEEVREMFEQCWLPESPPSIAAEMLLAQLQERLKDCKRAEKDAQQALDGALDESHRLSRECRAGTVAEVEAERKQIRKQIEARQQQLGQARAQAQARERAEKRCRELRDRIDKLREPVCYLDTTMEQIRKLESQAAEIEGNLPDLNSRIENIWDKLSEAKAARQSCQQFLDKAEESPDTCPICGSKGEYENAVQGKIFEAAKLDTLVTKLEGDLADAKAELKKREDTSTELRQKAADGYEKTAAEHERYNNLTQAEAELSELSIPDTEDIDTEEVAAALAELNVTLQELDDDIRKMSRRDAVRETIDKYKEARDQASGRRKVLETAVSELKQLRDQAITDTANGLEYEVNKVLNQVDPDLMFWVRTEDERGKPCADWSLSYGNPQPKVPLDLWGDGTQALGSAAILAVIMSRQESPCPVLLIDRIETITAPRRQQLVNALDQFRDRFANIVLAGVEGVETLPEGWQQLEVE